jgi:Skp family chaperone for outer membrane proteins
MGGFLNSLTFLAASLILHVPGAVQAQTYPTSDQFLPVATIDQERLFSESRFGKAFNTTFQKNASNLAEENRRIEKELADEEVDLTQKRKELSNVEFRKLADVFNNKVEIIRRDQAQKLNTLNSSRIQAQLDFFTRAKPVIVELMQERGIQFILNDQAIFMSGGSGDITNNAIERIDQVIGDNIQSDQQ